MSNDYGLTICIFILFFSILLNILFAINAIQIYNEQVTLVNQYDKIVSDYNNIIYNNQKDNALNSGGHKKYDYINITSVELENILSQKNITKINIKDLIYRLYDKDDMLSLLNTIKYQPYQSQIYDCDDFAIRTIGQIGFVFTGSAFGYIRFSNSSSAHAENVLVDKNKDVYIYQPQSKQLWNIEEYITEKQYSIKEILII